MRQYLLDLYEIQKTDLNIREQEKRLEALPVKLRELESAVATLKVQIATITEQREGTLRSAQSLRTVVDEEQQKIRKWESRLNDIRNQREYQALNRETEGSKRANREAEEKISELLSARDGHDKQLTDLQAQLEVREKARDAEEAQVGGAISSLRKEIETQTAARNAQIARVPKPLFRKYDAIRSKRFGIGLSMVSAGCCVGCNMRLPPQLYNILQRGDSIEQCPSCFRIIFWENILPAEEKTALAAAAP